MSKKKSKKKHAEHKHEKKHHNKDVEEDTTDKILDIYEMEGDLPDMTVLEQTNIRGWRFFFYSLFFFLIFSAIAGAGAYFFVFGGFGGDTQAREVKVEISSEEEITSGEEAIYILDYSNSTNVPVKKATLNVRYPAGFSLISAIPEPDKENNIWELGSLGAAESGTIKIKGRLIGEIDATKTLTSVLTYIPDNFSSEFQEVNSKTVTISKTDLELAFEGPEEVFVGEKAAYEIFYKSVSKEPLENLKVGLKVPRGFSVIDAEPELKDDSVLVWDIFGAFEEGSIKFEGVFDSYTQSSEPPQFTVTGFFNEGESAYKQLDIEQKIAVLKSDIKSSLVLNGGFDDKDLFLNDNLNYQLTVGNESDALLEDVSVRFYVKSQADFLKSNSNRLVFSLLDWQNLNASAEPVRSKLTDEETSEVFDVMLLEWTKDEIPGLGELEPDEELDINLSVNAISLEKAKQVLDVSNLGGFDLESYFEVNVGRAGGKDLKTVVQSNMIKGSFLSDLKLETTGRYFDEKGDALGQGPMPPKVGEETEYVIDWSLENSFHELGDVEVSVILPEYVNWGVEKELSGGELDYNFQTRVLKWKINQIPLSINELKAKFTVKLTPKAEHEEQILVIVPKATARAKDLYENKEFSVISGSITTNLPNDDFADGKGFISAK